MVSLKIVILSVKNFASILCANAIPYALRHSWSYQLWAKKSLKIPIIPYKDIRFLAIAQPFFCPVGLKFCMVIQETIIYRLVMKNHGFEPYLPYSIFWTVLGPKEGVAPQIPIIDMGLEPQNPTKKLTNLIDLLFTCYLEVVFPNFLNLDTPLSLMFNIKPT